MCRCRQAMRRPSGRRHRKGDGELKLTLKEDGGPRASLGGRHMGSWSPCSSEEDGTASCPLKEDGTASCALEGGRRAKALLTKVDGATSCSLE